MRNSSEIVPSLAAHAVLVLILFNHPCSMGMLVLATFLWGWEGVLCHVCWDHYSRRRGLGWAAQSFFLEGHLCPASVRPAGASSPRSRLSSRGPECDLRALRQEWPCLVQSQLCVGALSSSSSTKGCAGRSCSVNGAVTPIF